MADRVRIGKNPDLAGSPMGLWVTKPGKLMSSTNPDDFLVSPDNYLSMPYMKGFLSSIHSTSDAFPGGAAPAVGGQPTYSEYYYFDLRVLHNLGFVPQFTITSAASSSQVAAAWVDTTQLFVRLQYPPCRFYSSNGTCAFIQPDYTPDAGYGLGSPGNYIPGTWALTYKIKWAIYNRPWSH